MKRILTTVLVLFYATITVNGQIEFAKIFSDNMILQRNKPIKIWGVAKPGSIVEVFKGKVKKSTITKFDSTWLVVFKAEEANPYPQNIKVKSNSDSSSIKNILIGDVWLCIGQSNMEWPMSKEDHFIQEKSNANINLLRWYNPTYAGKNTYNILFSDAIKANLNTTNFYMGSWQASDSATFKSMSAVAYYFGKKIINDIHIPIGLINLSMGGAAIESFISEEALRSSKKFANKIIGNWLYNEALPVWIRERGLQNLGKIDHSISQDDLSTNHPFKPGFAFESGIRPIINLPIAGVLCYQGESNAQELDRVFEYGALMQLLIQDYRAKWKQPSLPFYFTQLSSIDTLKYKGHFWPQFRNEQRKIVNEIPYSGMAVTSDFGFKNDVHPTNKKIVGERLALIALSKTYFKNIVYSGPEPSKAIFLKNKIIISFKHTGGLLKTADSNVLHGFSLDGIHDAMATINKQEIIIFTNKKPDNIYYGWQPYSIGNLINKSLLPTSTFKIQVK
jgi:sialate O-acetylesterase